MDRFAGPGHVSARGLRVWLRRVVDGRGIVRSAAIRGGDASHRSWFDDVVFGYPAARPRRPTRRLGHAHGSLSLVESGIDGAVRSAHNGSTTPVAHRQR